ncbi:type II toxin-antitoxin system mRNA interferase toxin, RelE/StbE family [Chromatium okenii]|uniref:type II toxin-antitoxin system RelE/ParE family toxin n=1 Tax=Chromatium okenii TaxID=61644 RepID=UPI0026EA91CD|nr:type II toxin-antitoxin system mRNA interferase toxin, RelE/StbE family [Chromatium okenii]MBV5309867.1 type II toxin-antitoxin system mRNA interferase toxin, RelE/StbE family [Chromatium okenii]MBV5311092.1 type II toxin-antitoxin system mRNA interferase toxin, RelE/StbE family [Chromatium okenii]
MRKIVITPKFQRAYRKVTKRDSALQIHLDDVILMMQSDVFAPSLGTHKLSGALAGLWACTCGYDCRLIFKLEKDSESCEVILLLDIGNHNEVY